MGLPITNGDMLLEEVLGGASGLPSGIRSGVIGTSPVDNSLSARQNRQPVGMGVGVANPDEDWVSDSG
ncbi:unnamed protein product [Protopolystoma xenopodis]|uniref:Uncharacterized protein n=1 Tax=Protopolystoma xenopodis TaxID=117903 RepID=A0A3S5FDT4_9PLAT|nr:unnamed protein product [Protopolystoma xenopodis]